MATHRFRPTRYHNVIGTAEPCLRIADGDTVVTDTIDASGLDAREITVANRPNPMTGPFFIEGAEAGDTLAVRIDRLTPSRATGWTYSPLATTVLEPAAMAERGPQHRHRPRQQAALAAGADPAGGAGRSRRRAGARRHARSRAGRAPGAEGRAGGVAAAQPLLLAFRDQP